MKELAETRKAQLTDEQRKIFDILMDHVEKNNLLQMFIGACGRCGKTFVLNVILAAVRCSEVGGVVVLAMAMTGLTANLLKLG